MIFVVFSDIHGNQFAFREFKKEMRNIMYDKVLFCGDLCGYYYGQDEIARDLQHMEHMIAVKGNHDQYALDVAAGKKAKEELYPKYGHSYAAISKEVMEYVGQLPEKMEFIADQKKYLLIHGMPSNPLEGRLYPADEAGRELETEYQKYDFVFSGHTHFRADRMIGKTRVMNPGSLGQQRDGKGFSYAIFNTETEILEFRNVTFEFLELENEIQCKDPDNQKMIEILHRGE